MERKIGGAYQPPAGRGNLFHGVIFNLGEGYLCTFKSRLPHWFCFGALMSDVQFEVNPLAGGRWLVSGSGTVDGICRCDPSRHAGTTPVSMLRFFVLIAFDIFASSLDCLLALVPFSHGWALFGCASKCSGVLPSFAWNFPSLPFLHQTLCKSAACLHQSRFLTARASGASGGCHLHSFRGQ